VLSADNTASSAEPTAPAIQHRRLRRAASTVYATPMSSATISTVERTPGDKVTIRSALPA
jgi:hypothetical protein